MKPVAALLRGIASLGTVVVLMASAAMPPPAFAGQAVSPLETAIKATYLYKFAPFVTWPALPAGSDPAQPFVICVIGTDPFGAQLDRAVAGQSYASRPFQVSRLEMIDAQSRCDIAYVGGSAKQTVAAAVTAVHGAPVLTVTDGAETPGIVDFAAQDGHVRFRIDQTLAEAGSLNISSKLLGLALSVRTAKGVTQP